MRMKDGESGTISKKRPKMEEAVMEESSWADLEEEDEGEKWMRRKVRIVRQ